MAKPSLRSAAATVVFLPRSPVVSRRVGGRLETRVTRTCVRPSQRRIAVLAAGLGGEGGILGGRDRAPRALLRGRAQRQVRAAACQPATIAGLVRDDLQQPGPKGLATPEAPDCAKGLDEAVLRGFLRVGRG